MSSTDTMRNIQSVSRAIAILRCFDGYDELGLTEISKMIGLHKSTTAGLVGTLKEEKLLEQNEENSKLRLGIELFRLSLNIKMDIKDVCLPYLNDLLASTGETVNLIMREGNMAFYVEKKESPHSMRICTKIGQRLPLYCTGVGKVILAYLSEKEVATVLEHTIFKPFTKNTIVDKISLEEHLNIIREQGYAEDLEELEYGLVCVGVPIFDRNNNPIGGLSVSGPSTRMTAKNRLNIVKELFSVVNQISKDSGGKYCCVEKARIID